MFPFNQPIEEILLGSNIYMPLSLVVARTSPLNLQVGRAGKDVEGTLDLSNFHNSKGWDEFNPSDSHFRDMMVRSPVAGQIDPGYFVAALLRCCFGVLHVGMLMGSKKKCGDIVRWEPKGLRIEGCLVFDHSFFGCIYPNLKWPNGPEFLSMSKCFWNFSEHPHHCSRCCIGCLPASLQLAITLATGRNLVLPHVKLDDAGLDWWVVLGLKPSESSGWTYTPRS